MHDCANLALAGLDWRSYALARDPAERVLTLAVGNVVIARLNAEASK